MAIARLLALPIELVALVALSGCDLSGFSPPYAAAGRVEIVGELRDAAGSVVGTRVVDDADRISVSLERDGRLSRSTYTEGGWFQFEGLEPGIYRATLGLQFGEILAATEPVEVRDRDIVFPVLRAERQGDLSVRPNPLPGPVTIRYSQASEELVTLAIRPVGPEPTGPRVLLEDDLRSVGHHEVVWDGLNSAQIPVPAGRYWIVLTVGGEIRTDIVFVDQPVPEPPVRFVTAWGSAGSGRGQFRFPRAAAHGPSIDFYVVDQANHRIHRYGSAGSWAGEWGRFGKGDGEFVSPTDIAVDAGGNAVYVVDAALARVQKFTGDGIYVSQWGSPGTGNGRFLAPGGLDVGAGGEVFVADTNNRRVQRFTADGAFVAAWSTGAGPDASPRSLATTSAGDVYVLLTEEVVVYTADGMETARWNGDPAGAGFVDARGIDVDDEDRVFITDTERDRMLVFTRQGVLRFRWGAPGSLDGSLPEWHLDRPTGVAFDRFGNVYVADSGHDRIQMLELR